MLQLAVSRIIHPIHKTGNRHDISNYRPISIISCLSKLLDALITEELSSKLLVKLANQQHGFIRGKSTRTNQLIFNDFWSEALKYSQQVDAIYTDMSKAFDKVNHKRLISKIWNFGVRGNHFKLIGSYLINRTQAVRIYNCIAKPFNVTSGVPQGSHLGPLLFCVYINDIVNHIKHANILIYADDIKIFTVTNSVEDSLHLQADIKSMAKWCDEIVHYSLRS